jgi:hypothetical protein
MFPWQVRIFIFIPLAALQIVLLSMKTLGWQYDVEFTTFMVWLGDSVVSMLHLEVFEAWMRDLFAAWNINLPPLAKHWHNVFVLQWLMVGSWARAIGGIMSGRAEDGNVNWLASTSAAFGVLLWAGICSLIGAVAAGTMPVTSSAVFLWPFASIMVFRAGLTATDARSSLQSLVLGAALVALGWFLPPFQSAALPLLQWAYFLGVVGVVLVVLALRMHRPSYAETSFIIGFWALLGAVFLATAGTMFHNPLLALVGLVGVTGLASLLWGIWMLNYDPSSPRYLEGTEYRGVGIDIIGVFSLAATASWFFGKYTPL